MIILSLFIPAYIPHAATRNSTSTTRIHDIQGAAHLSPSVGTSVSGVPGIVTVVRNNGFYMQEPDATVDNNPATSEAIFVFTSSSPGRTIGDQVTVNGTVAEFRPGNSPTNLTTTEITSPVVTLISAGNPLPAPVVIGAGGRLPPTKVISSGAASGNVENAGSTFDPAINGIDFYESLEAMRVQINNGVAVGPTNSFGELAILPDGGTNPNVGVRTNRGGIVIQADDYNPEFVIIDDTLASVPVVNVGTTFNTIVGVMDYSFSNFKLFVTSTPSVATASPLTREVTSLIGTSNKLTISTFNVQNLDPGDGATKFNALADRIVNNLKSPDIVNLEEVQDNNGPTDNGVVDPSTTMSTLINAIVTAGGPTYAYAQINPVNDQDGGEPGGNIRVVFMYNPNRVTFVSRAGGTSTAATTVNNVNGVPQLSYSPGRIDPTNTAFNTSRKPLVGEFQFNGQTIYLIGNHFNSKGGDQPLYGPAQPPTLTSETQRNQQATIVNAFVQAITDIDANARIVLLGDLNDFQFSNPLNTVKGTQLDVLVDTLPLAERYTYSYNGNSQVLDHVLISKALTNSASPEYDIVHINSEFTDQVSDHDPALVRLNIPVPSTATSTATATGTASDTATSTQTSTATASTTPTATATVTNTATDTPPPSTTSTPTDTATVTLTSTVTNTPTVQVTTTPAPRPDTIGIFKDGAWALRTSNAPGAPQITAVFGNPTDLPIVGDWNFDGVDTLGVYRPTTGQFFLSDSNTAPTVAYAFTFGNPSDQPLAGRWSNAIAGSGVGVYRNSNGVVYLKNMLTTGFSDYFLIFGNPGDQPIAGDWAANHTDGIGVYRSSTQHWYLANYAAINGILYGDIDFTYDIASNRPVAGDWDGDGVSTFGYYTAAGVFALHSVNGAGGSDAVFPFGPANARPVAGKWVASGSVPITRLLNGAVASATRANGDSTGMD
jgi:endonuclease/exonuclease/phosphatase family metal-dependent hydrolase